MAFQGTNSKPLKKLIGIYCVLFVAIRVFFVWFNYPFEKDFALSLSQLYQGHIWTLLSYSFLHADFLHLFFNGLMLYFLGNFLLTYELSWKQFLKLFASGILLGATFWLVVHYKTPWISLIGASAGIMALFSYLGYLYPEKSMYVLVFFMFPINLKVRWLLLLTWWYEGFNCLFFELQGNSNIANSAHLGGLLAGFLAYKLQQHKEKKPKKTAQKLHYRVNIGADNIIQDTHFDVLKKLQEEGLESLTEEERKWLENYRKL